MPRVFTRSSLERVPDSGYFRAKLAQEALIKASPGPYTIIRATQFFEFVQAIAYVATEGSTVRLPPALMQPIASDDVVAALADRSLTPGAHPRTGATRFGDWRRNTLAARQAAPQRPLSARPSPAAVVSTAQRHDICGKREEGPKNGV